MYKHFFKRVLDILISGIALLLIGWFLILVAIFLHFANKGAGAVCMVLASDVYLKEDYIRDYNEFLEFRK